MERTLVIVKPDGVERGLIGDIISRYERRGFKLADAKLQKANRETLEKHYEEHRGKPFFDRLIDYMAEGLIMVMILEGENAIEIVRVMNGHKDPKIAQPGTIRGDYGNSVTRNIVHGSDCEEAAKREIAIWFPQNEGNV